MSLPYLKEAVDKNDAETLIRYVRLHFGDGNEQAGRKEIDKAWCEALKPLLDLPDTDREFIFNTLETCLLYTSPSPRDQRGSRMPSSA